jgi:hypothetical protein
LETYQRRRIVGRESGSAGKKKWGKTVRTGALDRDEIEDFVVCLRFAVCSNK